jgi:3-phenylpropionate/cinnamic acid dioxygenase small subunit
VSQLETAGTPVLPHTELYGRVLEFLHREAELLDTYKFDAWLSLFTDDLDYQMPVRTTRFLTEGDGFEEEFGLMAENHASLTTRVRRLETEFAWAEVPPSRTRHFVSNVIVEQDGDALEVRLSFMVTRTRQDLDYQMYTGQRIDRLLPDGDSFKISRRKILADQTVITATNLSVLF